MHTHICWIALITIVHCSCAFSAEFSNSILNCIGCNAGPPFLERARVSCFLHSIPSYKYIFLPCRYVDHHMMIIIWGSRQSETSGTRSEPQNSCYRRGVVQLCELFWQTSTQKWNMQEASETWSGRRSVIRVCLHVFARPWIASIFRVPALSLLFLRPWCLNSRSALQREEFQNISFLGHLTWGLSL